MHCTCIAIDLMVLTTGSYRGAMTGPNGIIRVGFEPGTQILAAGAPDATRHPCTDLWGLAFVFWVVSWRIFAGRYLNLHNSLWEDDGGARETRERDFVSDLKIEPSLAEMPDRTTLRIRVKTTPPGSGRSSDVFIEQIGLTISKID